MISKRVEKTCDNATIFVGEPFEENLPALCAEVFKLFSGSKPKSKFGVWVNSCMGNSVDMAKSLNIIGAARYSYNRKV